MDVVKNTENGFFENPIRIFAFENAVRNPVEGKPLDGNNSIVFLFPDLPKILKKFLYLSMAFIPCRSLYEEKDDYGKAFPCLIYTSRSMDASG